MARGVSCILNYAFTIHALWEETITEIFTFYSDKKTKAQKNIAIYFIRKIVPTKHMPKISAVGHFFLDKFENNQTRTCTTFFRTSKLTEPHFRPRG